MLQCLKGCPELQCINWGYCQLKKCFRTTDHWKWKKKLIKWSIFTWDFLFSCQRVQWRQFWDIVLCSLAQVDCHFRGAQCIHHQTTLVMKEIHTYETLVYFETTQCYIPEGCHLQTHCCKNIKSHKCSDISHVRNASIIRVVMEPVCTSETSSYF
jgi:hypothetical protein